MAGAKMSKSAGNSILVNDVLNESNALAVRYYLGSAQYRSVLDYNEGVIEEAESAIERIAAFLNRAGRKLSKDTLAKSSSQVSTPLPKKFIEAMNDDLNMPAALAVLHESVRAGNAALDSDKFEEATVA